MSLTGLLRGLSPCVLALVLIPTAFLLMPNGMPFVFAHCSTLVNGHPDITNTFHTICAAGATEVAKVYPTYTAETETSPCRLIVSIENLVINSTGCKVFWRNECISSVHGTSVCNSALVATGPFNGVKATTLTCDQGHTMKVKLEREGASCIPGNACNPIYFFEITADSTDCTN